jgi:hypothetical protein
MCYSAGNTAVRHGCLSNFEMPGCASSAITQRMAQRGQPVGSRQRQLMADLRWVMATPI